MWNAITSGAVEVDQGLIERVLKTKYQDKAACRMAARLAAGASLSDIMDGNDSKKKGGVTSWLDFFNEIALMLCVGMSPTQIGLFYASMIVGTVVIVLTVKAMIPDSVWKKCKVCNGPKGSQNCRPGTPEECKRKGANAELVISLFIAIIVLAIVRGIFIWGLKLKVYNISALLVEGAVRTIA